MAQAPESLGQQSSDPLGSLDALSGDGELVLDGTTPTQAGPPAESAARILLSDNVEQRLRALQAVTASFVAAQTLAEVRRIILQEVTQALGANSGNVRRIVGQELVLEAYEPGAVMSDEQVRRLTALPLKDAYPATDAVRTGEALFFGRADELLERYPGLAGLVATQDIQASAHLPLKRGSEVFGALSLNFAAPHSWDADERSFATALADRAAVAYERARLFEAERDARLRAERLQALTARLATALTPPEIIKAVFEEGLPALGATAGSVVRLDGEELVILDTAGYPEDLVLPWQRFPLSANTPISAAVRSGASVWLASQAEFERRFQRAPDPDALALSQAWSALPLIASGRVLGALGLSYPQPRGFDQETRRFATTLADLCAQALERTMLQDSLRESEERHRTLVEASAQIIWRADSQGRLIDRRERWSAMSGISLAELPDEPLELIHPDDRAGGTARWHQALERVQPVSFEQRVRGPDGVYRHWQVRAAPVVEADGRVREWIGTDSEITERKRAEEALRDYTARLQQLNTASLGINAAPTREAMLRRIVEEARALIGTAMAVVNLVPAGDWAQAETVASLAPAYEAWGEYAAPLSGEGIYRLVYTEQHSLRLTQAELTAHRGWRAFGAEGAAHPPLNGLLVVPLVDSDGASIGVLQLSEKGGGPFTPADEALLIQLAQLASVALENQRLYEQEQAARAQAEEASRLKDEFLATVSHELRTPLTALLGYAQLLLTRKRDEAYVARTLAKIERSARDQALIIEDLLDVSQIITGKLRIEPAPTDLIAVVQAAVDTVRPAVEAKGLRLELELSPAAGTVFGDASRLQQVIWNLLSNAVKFTPAGGLIAVELAAAGREAQLTVRDTGQGISAAFLPFVFDRFRQADSASNRAFGGLGLGLAIVRHLAELHGGTVLAASAGEGQGAIFTLRLPLAVVDAPPAPAEQASPQRDGAVTAPPALHQLRVLVVDDQPTILELLDEVLTYAGAVVQLCDNARAALATIREWRPDILLSDIAMPGEDGYWLIGQVRALAPDEGGNTPAAALTTFVRVEERAKILAAGFQLCVSKPVEPAELRAVLADLARSAAE